MQSSLRDTCIASTSGRGQEAALPARAGRNRHIARLPPSPALPTLHAPLAPSPILPPTFVPLSPNFAPSPQTRQEPAPRVPPAPPTPVPAATSPVTQQAPPHPATVSFGRLTKAHTLYIGQYTDAGLAPPASMGLGLVRGLHQQVRHVQALLHHADTHLGTRDFGALGQACRRMQVVVDAVPHLAPLQNSLTSDLIAAALRSSAMAHADLGTWSMLLHGLAAAHVATPDMQRLLSWALMHLPPEPWTGPQAAGLAATRPGLCARAVWAYAATGYTGDATPLLRCVAAAAAGGSMRQATPAHWGTLMWSAANLRCEDHQLLPMLLRDGLTALTAAAALDAAARRAPPATTAAADLTTAAATVPLYPAAVSSACWALAIAGYVAPGAGQTVAQQQQAEALGLPAWLEAVQGWVAAGGAAGASQFELSQLRWAARTMGVSLVGLPTGPEAGGEGEGAAQSGRVAGVWPEVESGGESENESSFEGQYGRSYLAA